MFPVLKSAKFGHLSKLAPAVGFEPTTDRLTADCSTAELSRNNIRRGGRYRNRTDIEGFAVLCITTLPTGHQVTVAHSMKHIYNVFFINVNIFFCINDKKMLFFYLHCSIIATRLILKEFAI